MERRVRGVDEAGERWRGDAPLLDAWLTYQDALADGLAPFFVPGHKGRTDLVGDVVAGDAPLYGGLAEVKRADDVLADAQARAAALWGVDWCRFSVGGSTHANQAALLALGRPGQEVVVARTAHRSVHSALVLAGLRPVWVRPGIDAGTGLPTAVPVAAVVAALAAHPDACAVVLGDPSYVGTIGDVARQAAAAHDAGVPLVVDAAWAAHHLAGPPLPAHALALGADAMVISAHKLLPAVSQAALLLARTTRAGGLLDPARLDRAFAAGNTTSPNGQLLASTDAARALVAADGPALATRLVDLVTQARARLDAVPGLRTLAGPLPDGTAVDPSKLVVLLSGTGAHGHRVERDLIAAGLPVEMADRDVLIPIVSFADDAATVTRLVDALVAAVERHRGEPRRPEVAAAWSVDAVQACRPRDAFFAPHETVPADTAVGRVSAELVAPYPPGVPVLAPGEVVGAAALAALRAVRDDGGRIAYAADPTLRTLQVVAN